MLITLNQLQWNLDLMKCQGTGKIGSLYQSSVPYILKGGVHGSAHVHESKYFLAFARYDPSLFNLIRCL